MKYKDIVNPLPINACNAESQVYCLHDEDQNHLNDLDMDSDVVTLLTT